MIKRKERQRRKKRKWKSKRLKRRKRIPPRERFGSDKSKHTLEPAQEGREHRESEWEEKDEEDEEEEYRAPAREQAPARRFQPHWPLPALGIPNPVITHNTQGPTGSRRQHGSPLAGSGPSGTCVSTRLFSRVISPLFSHRSPKTSSLVSVASARPVCLLRVFPKSNTHTHTHTRSPNLLTCSGFSRHSV